MTDVADTAEAPERQCYIAHEAIEQPVRDGAHTLYVRTMRVRRTLTATGGTPQAIESARAELVQIAADALALWRAL